MTAAKWKETIIPLAHPIKLESGDVVLSITVREPDGEALEEIDDLGLEEGKRPSVGQSLAMIRALAKVPKEVTNRMHRDDITSVMEACAPLLGGEATE